MQKMLNTPVIQSALTEHGMTQKQLAETLGVSAQAVTNWLKNKDFPRPAALLKIASTLALSFDQLVQPSEEGRPVIAFRKKGGAKTTAAHLARANGIGMLLKPLVPHLPELQALRTRIASPSTNFLKLQSVSAQTRDRLGIGPQAVLEYGHLIGEFKTSGAVLVPVLWGKKGNHENAMHIYLPKEDVTFIFLNLDTRLEDFKFWMAHELAHVYTPNLAGKEEGEDFADAMAGSLLFPLECVKAAYVEAIKANNMDGEIRVLKKYANQHAISLNTVYQQLKKYTLSTGQNALQTPEKSIHAVRNTVPGRLISEVLFDPLPPEPKLYIAACEHVFQTDFFSAVKRMIHEQETGASYIGQLLDCSAQDAHALYEELRN